MAEEQETTKANFKGIGRSGTLVTSETVQNDYLQALIGNPGQIVFADMLLSDSQVRKNYHAVSNPIKSADWDIEPASEDPKDIEVAALIKQIIFKDLPEGFIAKLDEILTFPWHGHAVFEVIHVNKNDKVFGPYTGLLNLAYRDQRTLDKWKFSKEGLLEEIHQKQSGDIEIDAWMPADSLMIFYNEKKGNDTGYPFCRMLYGNYKRKLLYKQLQAIGMERAALPVPHAKLPPGVDFESDEYKAIVEQLEAFTQAESAYFITPDGYDLVYNTTNTFNPAHAQIAIKAENEEMVGAIVAMFLEMGIGGNAAVGSSTAESVKFFTAGLKYLANKIADPFNLKLIPSLVAMNFGDTVEVMPKLVHSGIDEKAGAELMAVVTGYVEKGVITPDEQLEDHIRKVHGLPKKIEGAMLDNGAAQDGGTPPDVSTPSDSSAPSDSSGSTGANDGVELSAKRKKSTPRDLISKQGEKIALDISDALEFSSAKYINDIMARYKQLAEARKQNATSKVKMGGANNLKKDLKRSLTDTASKAIAMARTEIPSKSDVQLSSKDADIKRLTDKYGDFSEIKLNEFSQLPTHIQVLIAKQSDLISSDSLNDLKKRIDFSFSSIETKSSDANVIKQSMEEDAGKFIDSNQVRLKGNNASALMVNEGRDTFFFEDDVLDEIHSFTFVNISPVAAICKELAGTTFNTNDAESLRYSPPLHHNCKSYLRANLKVSKGTEKLDVSTLSPSAEAKKSITL